MGVTRDEVIHVARLARIRLGPEEVDRIRSELDEIVEHVRALERIPLDESSSLGAPGSEPQPSVPDEDRGEPDPLRRPLSELAPRWQEGFFVVPRVPGMEGGPVPDPEEA